MKKLSVAVVLMIALVAVCSSFRPADARAGLNVVEITSELLPRAMNVNVTLPESYDCDTTVRFPVVYLLNGHGGNNNSWGTVANLDSLATAHNFIIVCPDGMNSWYFDSPVRKDMQMESFITGELLPFIDTHYRTLARPESRAITGLSMGGHGAMWLAMRHPDMFHNAGSTSGGVDFTPWPGSWNIKDALGDRDSNPELWSSHTVASLVKGLKPGQLNIVFDCGTEDFFYEVNCALDSTLNAMRIPHRFSISPGAHNGAYWGKAIIPQLEFFAAHLNSQN